MPRGCHYSCPCLVLLVLFDDGLDLRFAALGDERGEFVDGQAGLMPFDDLVLQCFLHWWFFLIAE